MIVMTTNQLQALLATDVSTARAQIKQLAPVSIDAVGPMVGVPNYVAMLAIAGDPDLVLVPESLADLITLGNNPTIAYKHSMINTGS